MINLNNLIEQINNNKNKKKLKKDACVGVSDFEILKSKDVSIVSQEAGWQISKFNFPDIWRETKGEGIKVAVIDTGVTESHPDIEFEKTLNFVGISGTSWWDSINNKVIVPDVDYSTYIPAHSHATHVSGIIGAKDNTEGMVGVAPECKIYSLRALDDSGSGSYSDLSIALLWCLYNEDIDIINMSLGGFYSNESFWQTIKLLYDNNKIIVASAGNEYYEADYRGYISFPGQYDETISVAAIDEFFDKAYFSSAGPNINVAAPGVNILSTVLNNSYGIMSGTCLSANSKVYTDKGPVKIKDIKIGDNIFSLDSDYNIKPQKCLNVISNGIKEVYKIRIASKIVIATSNHPFLCLDKEIVGGGEIRKRYIRKLKWKELKDIKKGDIIVTAKQINYQIENDKYSNAICQFVGAYLGDGNLFWDKRRNQKDPYGFDLHIRQGMDEKSNLPEKYIKIIQDAFKEELNVLNYNGSLRVNSKKIASKIKLLGLGGDVYSKRIPDWCFSLSNEKKLHLLAGLIDSDGSTYQKNGYVRLRFELANYDLVCDIKMICEMLGLKTSKVMERTRTIDILNRGNVKDYTSYSVNITGCDQVDIPVCDVEAKKRLSYIKNNNKLKIKISKKDGMQIREIPPELVDSDVFLSRVCEIEKLKDKEEVFDLTIENSHNFVVDNVIVHNSMSAPFVSGLIALMLSKHRKLGGKTPIKTVEDVREHLNKFALDDDVIEGRDIFTGWGIVNVNNIVDTIRVKPEPSRTPFGKLYAGSIIQYNDRPWELK